MRFQFPGRSAFTLVEVMVVVLIIGIIGGIGIPSIVYSVQKHGMYKALSDLEEAAFKARETAIYTGKPAELVVNRKDNTVSAGGLMVTFDAGIEITDVNLFGLDYSEDETVTAKFYPNGTADEFGLVLQSDQGEQRGFFIEVVTGRPEIFMDLKDWRR